MSGPYSTISYSMPMAVPSKGNQYPTYSQYSISPPECDDSISSASGVPSYSNSGYSATTASYIGSSSGDYDSTGSASGVDFQEYMQERFANSFNPIPLDRSMAVQAQSSGKLNAKHRELVELQKQAQARLARTRERFQEGMRDAREVRGDLEWTQKKVSSLQSKASRKHPKEYSKARARYPSPEY
ncbi:KxDL domain-containing protein [Purpureocillium lavendulum]|uniref:Biogenesis of lysosome-related organelles complex 1 subunit KXD1 n=1 Tax=Purpureocillium lavendulum TaxID=1247861 RepID=A0AB34FQK3_9HYPO|nr:KxDL domain-containing protein [Purpureocillium lavendulum]